MLQGHDRKIRHVVAEVRRMKQVHLDAGVGAGGRAPTPGASRLKGMSPGEHATYRELEVFEIIEAVQQCETSAMAMTERMTQIEGQLHHVSGRNPEGFEGRLLEATSLIDSSLEEHRVALGCISTWANKCDTMFTGVYEVAEENKNQIVILADKLESQQSCVAAQQDYLQAQHDEAKSQADRMDVLDAKQGHATLQDESHTAQFQGVQDQLDHLSAQMSAVLKENGKLRSEKAAQDERLTHLEQGYEECQASLVDAQKEGAANGTVLPALGRIGGQLMAMMTKLETLEAKMLEASHRTATKQLNRTTWELTFGRNVGGAIDRWRHRMRRDKRVVAALQCIRSAKAKEHRWGVARRVEVWRRAKEEALHANRVEEVKALLEVAKGNSFTQLVEGLEEARQSMTNQALDLRQEGVSRSEVGPLLYSPPCCSFSLIILSRLPREAHPPVFPVPLPPGAPTDPEGALPARDRVPSLRIEAKL